MKIQVACNNQLQRTMRRAAAELNHYGLSRNHSIN